ncbi:MAG: pectinacetylesterase family protein [Lachnospiraceae bacterium]|nr:pectinacetylesterase family protein [Lachnospiraceae bacterium]
MIRLPKAGYSVPLLKMRPRFNRWYRVSDPGGITGDGCPWHFYLSKGHQRNLIIFLAGGGVAWDAFTASHPTGAAGVLRGDPGFYWANLRPLTEFMNINQGITENMNPGNYFYDWNMAVITYSTGDFHLGDSDYYYDRNDPERVMHFRGYRNFSIALEEIKKRFPEPVNLLIAGDSAGAFGTAALAGEILKRYDPERQNVTVCSDSALLPWDKWKKIMRKRWNTKPGIYEKVVSDNPVTDWYRALHSEYGDKIRYLFACSCRDEVLQAYWNATKGNDYGTDDEMRLAFRDALKNMVFDLSGITGKFCFFLNEYPVHTVIRNPLFHTGRVDGVSMHEWLKDMVNGELYSVGMGLISK